jgi:hypothetical protein
MIFEQKGFSERIIAIIDFYFLHALFSHVFLNNLPKVLGLYENITEAC